MLKCTNNFLGDIRKQNIFVRQFEDGRKRRILLEIEFSTEWYFFRVDYQHKSPLPSLESFLMIKTMRKGTNYEILFCH